jgi:DNA-binding transcriptional LysR family regulator
MDLKDIDLNLLVIFRQLLQERRVSTVADNLGLTQPTVSNALNRLRQQLGDELFLRTSRGMEPTAFAMELAEPISYALSSIHETLNQRTRFDPENSQRKFILGMSDIAEIDFLPKLMKVLADVAPHVSISTIRTTGADLAADMEAGRIDIAIGWLPHLKTGFFQRRLFTQQHVCLFRRGHHLDKETPLTKEEFEAAEHVVVSGIGTGHATIDASIGKLGVKRKAVLTVPHFVAIGHILATTDMIATVPERFARHCTTPFGLRYVPLPLKLSEIGINIFWHSRFHKEPGNQWLRSLLSDHFSDRLTDKSDHREDRVD